MTREMGDGRAPAGHDELRRELAETTEALRLRHAPLTEESVEPPIIIGRPPESGVQLQVFSDCAVLMPQSAWGQNVESLNNVRLAFDHARANGNLDIIVDFGHFKNEANGRSEDLIAPLLSLVGELLQAQQKIHLVNTPRFLAAKLITPHMAAFCVAHEDILAARRYIHAQNLAREQQ